MHMHGALKQPKKTRSSAIAEGPRDAISDLTSWQLLHEIMSFVSACNDVGAMVIDVLIHVICNAV